MSDNLHSYKIKPFEDAKEYPAWKCKLLDVLTDLELKEYVIGPLVNAPIKIVAISKPPATETIPADTTAQTTPVETTTEESDEDYNKHLKEWKHNSEKALSTICLRVSAAPLVYIKTCTSPQQAWLKLEQIYQPQGALAVIQLKCKITRAQCEEGEDVEAHIRNMIGWQQELQELGHNIEEEEFAANLLTSLPDS